MHGTLEVAWAVCVVNVTRGVLTRRIMGDCCELTAVVGAAVRVAPLVG